MPQRRDAAALAPLVLTSGLEEFMYLLDASPEVCEDFLRHAIAAPSGRFSRRRHIVATMNNRPVAILALQDGRNGLLDNPRAALDFLRYFGIQRTSGIVRRGLLLEREIPMPNRRQTLMAHCATRPDMRGAGIFSVLFRHVMQLGALSASAGQSLILDVLQTNMHAATLYPQL